MSLPDEIITGRRNKKLSRRERGSRESQWPNPSAPNLAYDLNELNIVPRRTPYEVERRKKFEAARAKKTEEKTT